ncbi:2-hydroxy-3-carboxy-6-oxo-7-methylocta-2,4-dienoate decarboxylase (plasmid) [Vibrio nigripulchritudo]|uniref:amidohydrolase family protein n=1 Tax=Vibrio nigripulchritudo TaxID=28173 RepID=UPI001909CDC2|nr:amidohydrolase family protein [Vibrio nigripulchritudo]BCL73725.1 2-hydroxy-3-carboxy-6-oxo-7-methylocta-2,4-dienoa te decarboxylase [Vibrio nigripulchritudo]BDU35100.1 2-hydroxy-3-carboxy-6-oxo-7-methylocta-2,4-dienoate decarboxylase [Vibrio nigripulchritudo]
MAVIDIHNHFVPSSWPNLAKKFGGTWPWLRHIDQKKAMLMMGDRDFRPVTSALWQAEQRIEDMDRDHIDVQVISATPILFAYERKPAQAAECANIFNDLARELCSHQPNRIKSLAQVPLQDTDLACKEISRAMKNGHLGIQIGNHVGDLDLDHEGILTVFQHCASEGAAVLVHPWDMQETKRNSRYMLRWLVDMPAETELSILSLILTGAFERLPENLKLCFAHGGGSFPYLLGRIDNAWQNRDIVRKDCPNLPSSYVNRFSVDSAVYNDEALWLLVDAMGEEQVMFGTDYPFPLGEQDMGKLIRKSKYLSAEQRNKLLGSNAASWLGLKG